MTRPLLVAHFQRRATDGNFSVERLFDDVRAALPFDITIKLRINQHASRGIVGRVMDALAVRRERCAVNHVLGDVHYLAWFLPRQGTVLTVLDCVSLERLSGLRRYLFWFLWYWWPIQRSDHITVISEYTRRSLLRWVDYPDERIHVIHPPLSGEYEASPQPQRGERLRLLQVGSNENKNLARVIEALKGLPVRLVIVGRLKERDRELLDRFEVPFENHLDLTRERLLEQYRLADAVVFASTYEGFGMPIVEAQAVGRPVITSNVCSMPEAAGGAACIVDPFDIADIRRGVCRLIDDPAYGERLVELGRSNAKRFSAARIAKCYADLYRKIISEGA